MTREGIYERLTTVFREIFDDENIIVSDITAASDIDGWDSLAHLNLIIAIETAFRIKFSVSDVMSMHHVGDIVTLLQAKGK